MGLNKIVHFVFDKVGVEIHRKVNITGKFILHVSPTLVFDVGANSGQFVKKVREAGYTNQIISFEPIKTAFDELVINAENDPNWRVHARCAIGSSTEEILINRSENSVSSSILPMLQAHIESANNSIYIDQELVQVMTLDEIFPTYVTKSDLVYLKIDTQGYEEHVLNGAVKSLPLIDAIQIELSIVQLYEDQKLFRFFLEFLEAKGFHLWGIEPGFANPATGQLLQFDAFFLRT